MPEFFQPTRIVIALMVAAQLVACASQRRSITVDTGIVDQLTARGYPGVGKLAVASTTTTWDFDGVRTDLEVVAPTGSGPLPWIIYLPGLGESVSAGRAWRLAWAQSGYAVVSVQPLPSDASAWTSPLARAGEFQALARERFSAKTMTARMLALRQVVAEISRRRERQEAPWQRLDPNRLALAGFELGAYTAMIGAGELIGTSISTSIGTSGATTGAIGSAALPASYALPITPRAIVALSPYASTPPASALPATSTRAGSTQTYAAITTPVLSTTSYDDSDPLTLVRTPSARRLPFDNMPPGNKYLLMLNDVSHEALAGPTIEQLTQLEPEQNEPQERMNSGGRRGGQRNAGAAEAFRVGRPAAMTGVQVSPTAQASGIALIQGVSTAFLDAYVRDDARAKAWLERDAPRWLEGRAVLSTR